MSQAEVPQPLQAIDRFVALYDTRQMDWDVFSFQEKADPSYRRAQIRYVGGGGTDKHDDPNTLPAGHFTLSIMVLPPGHGGPAHYHETEEVFFVLEGEVTCVWEQNGQQVERVLKQYDAILNPPGVPHFFRNDGDREARFNIMVGAARPKPPVYISTSIDTLRAAARQEAPPPTP